jgi:hypothetical protein
MTFHLKLSIPQRESHYSIAQYLQNQGDELFGWRIHLNDGIEEADAWVVIEGLLPEDSFCSVRKGMTFFASAEVAFEEDYFVSQPWTHRFLNQFDSIWTCNPILRDNAEQHPPFLPWMINANHGPSIWKPHIRDFEFFRRLEKLDKPHLMSVICSNKSFTPGHALRRSFVEKIVSEFKDKVHWFGNGVRQIDEKWDGLASYRFSIAIENRIAPRLITEKIQDVFLALAVPVYAGAPDIADYFDPQGMFRIDLRDWKTSRDTIERILEEDEYESMLPKLLENKTRVLQNMNFLKRIIRLVEKHFNPSAPFMQRKVFSLESLMKPSERLQRSLSWRMRYLEKMLSS